MDNKNYYSTAISILLHLFIITLPFSFDVKKEYKEDELLLVVIDEKKIPRAKPKPEKKACNCENCTCNKQQVVKKKEAQKVLKNQVQKIAPKKNDIKKIVKKKLQKIPPKKIVTKKIEKKVVKTVPKRKQFKTKPQKKPQQKKVIVDYKPVKEARALSKSIKPVQKNTQTSPLPEIKDNHVSDKGDESLVSPSPDNSTYKRNFPASAQSSNNESENDTVASSGPIDAKFGSIRGPKFLHREIPRYPRRALKRRKEGVVLLRLTIDKNGNLQNVNVEKDGGYGFAQSAIDAVRKSTFLPAKLNGKPIACKCLLPVKFVLNK